MVLERNEIMTKHLSFPAKDSYASLTASDGKTYYLFQDYRNGVVHDYKYLLRELGGKTSSYYPFFEVNTTTDRSGTKVLLNLFQVTVASNPVYLSYPTDLQALIDNLDETNEDSVSALKTALDNYYAD